MSFIGVLFQAKEDNAYTQPVFIILVKRSHVKVKYSDQSPLLQLCYISQIRLAK